MNFEENDMIPTREEAERLLTEAELLNPGPWGDHSRTVAHCAEKIAAACEGMDSEKAYILGLLQPWLERDWIFFYLQVTFPF